MASDKPLSRETAGSWQTRENLKGTEAFGCKLTLDIKHWLSFYFLREKVFEAQAICTAMYVEEFSVWGGGEKEKRKVAVLAVCHQEPAYISPPNAGKHATSLSHTELKCLTGRAEASTVCKPIL